MPWLSMFILRLVMGERLRQATPKELRWYSAAFAFIPVWGALFVYGGRSCLEQAGPVAIWLYGMAFILGGFLWLAAWVKCVSANVSWWLGGFTWMITLCLALTGRLI